MANTQAYIPAIAHAQGAARTFRTIQGTPITPLNPYYGAPEDYDAICSEILALIAKPVHAGLAILASGTASVTSALASNTAVIGVSYQGTLTNPFTAGVAGTLRATNNGGGSFTITSTNGSDTNTVCWQITELNA